MTLLGWIIDVYELQRGFDAAQRDGTIPDDELFSPHFFMSVDQNQDRFPYWLSARKRILLQRLCDKGLIRDPVASGIMGRDKSGTLHGIEFIRVDEERGVIVESAMRVQSLPIYMGDLLEEILSIDLANEVTAFLEGKVAAVPLQEIDARLRVLEERCGHCWGHSYRNARAAPN